MVTGEHPWLLVGPWYRWSTPNVPAGGRNSVPVFQKYETADLVGEFLKNPQHSLVFLEQEDRVFEITPRLPPIPLLKEKKQSFSNNLLKNTGIRSCSSMPTNASIWWYVNCTAMSRASPASTASRSAKPVSSFAAIP